MNIILDKCLANLTGKNSFNEISVNELETFTKAYPYFAIGHLLLSKKLLTENNPGYEKQLQKTALYVPDVHWLHYQLTSKNTDAVKAIMPGAPLVAANTTLPDVIEAPLKTTSQLLIATPHQNVLKNHEDDGEVERQKELQNTPDAPDQIGTANEENTTLNELTPTADETVLALIKVETYQQSTTANKAAETVITEAFSIEEIEEADENGKALFEPETLSINTEKEKEATNVGDEAVSAITSIETTHQVVVEGNAVETVITKEFLIEEIEEADQKGKALLKPQQLTSITDGEEKTGKATGDTSTDDTENKDITNVTLTEQTARANDSQTVAQNTTNTQYSKQEKWQEVILTTGGTVSEGKNYVNGITLTEEISLGESEDITSETALEDNVNEVEDNGIRQIINTSENEPQATRPTREEAVANDTDYLAPELETSEKHDESTDQMLKNIKLVLDTPLPAGQNANTETIVPIDPYYTVDYFASQGIKLILNDNGDQLARNLKSFTQWLKHMKKLGPEDTPGRQGDKMEEDMVIKIADFSNIQREVITETMADVLVKQGKIEKAVQVYIKLSFLQPDKSAYFANQIKILKAIK